MDEREQLTLEPGLADSPEVGRWLAAMHDSRDDTLRELEGVTDDMVDARPPESDNTIGASLYHVALVEADWIVDDMDGNPLETTELAPLFPLAARDEQGILSAIAGVPLAEHLDRLARVRSFLLDRMRTMPLEDFTTPRAREGYDVSPAWVIHHLLQHESEHRSEIGWLRRHAGSSG